MNNNRLLTGSPSRDHIAGGYIDDTLPQLNDINNKLFIKLKSRYYDNKTLITKYFNRVPMSMRRSLLVKVAFHKASLSHGENNEYILIKDILKKFHPQVYDNKKQPIQSLHWFIQDFKDINNTTNNTNNTTTNSTTTSTNSNDNKIYFDQFEKYYKYLSCFIENDNVFEKIIVDIIKVDGEDTINFMKGVKVSYNSNDYDNDFNPTISYSELPNVNTSFTSPRPSSAQQSPANAKVKFSIPEEDDNDALSYFDNNNNSPLKGLNNNNNSNSKQPPESYYSNGSNVNNSNNNNGNGNKSRSKQVGVSPLRSNKPPLAQSSLGGTPQFIPKAPSQSSPRSNVPNVRMQSPNTYNNNSNNNVMYSSMNNSIQAADFSPPKNPESISSGMIQRLQEQMHSMQASFSLGVEEMNKLKEIEYQSQQQIHYYKSQLQASFNQNNDLHIQNEDLKKQNHKLKGQLKSVFSSYEALLALHEQTQQTLHQQNSVLKNQADEIKNLVNNNTV